MPEGTYVELVRSLFSTLLTTAIMAVSFAAVGLLVLDQTSDRLLAALTALGCFAAAGRLAVLVLNRGEAQDETIAVARVRVLERRFAVAYLIFAAVFGAFSARAFQIATPQAHTLVVGLLFGYGAGVAAGLSLRPWISVPSILLATLPTIAVAAITGIAINQAVGALLAVFLLGGLHSMLTRYQSEQRKITMRRLFSTLARSDALTGLPNRLSLREQFEAFAAVRKPGELIAIHCLDLDRFKPVNDRYGHPVGDLLLKAVSERLGAVLRKGDFAARMGGDEFIVVQSGLSHAGEADLLARRIVRTISQTFSIAGHDISIGTSVGYALSPDDGTDLDRLIASADETLYRVKRAGGGVAAFGGRASGPNTWRSA